MKYQSHQASLSFPVTVISDSLNPVIKVKVIKVIKDFGIIQMVLKATKKNPNQGIKPRLGFLF